LNIVIVGCGRVGAFLAGQLDKAGHAVTIVDLDRGSFVHLPQEFKGTTLLGNGTAVFALTQGDNRNLMAAQIARQIFGVKRVIAKVNDPIRAALYREHDISTVSRTTILGTLLEAMLMGDAEVGKVLIEKSRRAEATMAGELG
jgi:trk system potassium uptake protein TrkA